jgi:hypothetical protein
MAELINEIGKYDTELAEKIRAACNPSDTVTQVLAHCLARLQARLIAHTNAHEHHHPLMRRFVSPDMVWRSRDSDDQPVGTRRYEDFFAYLSNSTTQQDGTRSTLGFETSDVTAHVDENLTAATCWVTVRVHGYVWLSWHSPAVKFTDIHTHSTPDTRLLNGVVRDVISRVRWKRTRDKGWMCVAVETMRGLHHVLA